MKRDHTLETEMNGKGDVKMISGFGCLIRRKRPAGEAAMGEIPRFESRREDGWGVDLGFGGSGKVCGVGGLMKLREACGDYHEEELRIAARNRELIFIFRIVVITLFMVLSSLCLVAVIVIFLFLVFLL